MAHCYPLFDMDIVRRWTFSVILLWYIEVRLSGLVVKQMKSIKFASALMRCENTEMTANSSYNCDWALSSRTNLIYQRMDKYDTTSTNKVNLKKLYSILNKYCFTVSSFHLSMNQALPPNQFDPSNQFPTKLLPVWRHSNVVAVNVQLKHSKLAKTVQQR